MPRKNVDFKTIDGVTLRGWFYTPESISGKLPCLVMAHGWSALKEMVRYAISTFLNKHLRIASNTVRTLMPLQSISPLSYPSVAWCMTTATLVRVTANQGMKSCHLSSRVIIQTPLPMLSHWTKSMLIRSASGEAHILEAMSYLLEQLIEESRLCLVKCRCNTFLSPLQIWLAD